MENCDAQEAAIRMNGWFNLGLDKQPHPKRQDDQRVGGGSPPTSGRTESNYLRPPTLEPPPAETDCGVEDVEPNPPLKFALKNLETDHPYFKERGLNAGTVAHFELGFCKRGTMAGRIVIPMHDCQGQLVGYAGRWPGEPPEKRPKYKLPEGFKKMSELFNLHRALREPGNTPLIVVEGFFDVMILWQSGWKRVASLMGSHLSVAHERHLADAAKSCGVILLLDEDDAGRAGRAKALLRLAQKVFVKALTLPREGVQPDHLTQAELASLLT